MNKIDINLLKKIRQKTKISIYECKKALEKNENNYKKTITYLKNKINLINKKKELKETFILNKMLKNKAAMIKIDCETDFLTKNIEIKYFAEKVLNFILNKEKTNIKKINKKFNCKKKYLINKFKELIKIDKFCFIKNKNINIYLHNFKIGTIISVINTIDKKIKIKKEKIKKIAMHITATDYSYLLKINKIKKNENLFFDFKKIKNEINKNHKIFNNINFLKQPFIFNNKLSLKNYLEKNNIEIDKFCKFETNK